MMIQRPAWYCKKNAVLRCFTAGNCAEPCLVAMAMEKSPMNEGVEIYQCPRHRSGKELSKKRIGVPRMAETLPANIQVWVFRVVH